jgi:hypothetical protein
MEYLFAKLDFNSYKFPRQEELPNKLEKKNQTSVKTTS